MLKRFRKKPQKAAIRKPSHPVTVNSTRAAIEATVPATGPAMPIWAWCSASVACWRWKMAAPKKGMKSGAVAFMPWRRISTTWPISCSRIMVTSAPAASGPRRQA